MPNQKVPLAKDETQPSLKKNKKVATLTHWKCGRGSTDLPITKKMIEA